MVYLAIKKIITKCLSRKLDYKYIGLYKIIKKNIRKQLPTGPIIKSQDLSDFLHFFIKRYKRRKSYKSKT